ncbi:unnamed protein product [Macrosiphum euphorbiae]|uniref:Uncharacterized protein n=1 Tax=Macrosiphum euphorbiae TaxID=13131 RepID=A0AAV0WUS7_9HEMI|nr:unnamed protein product [Macrosiphum euphorbiae]
MAHIILQVASRRSPVFRLTAGRWRLRARPLDDAVSTWKPSVLGEPQPPGFADGRRDDAESSHRTRSGSSQGRPTFVCIRENGVV